MSTDFIISLVVIGVTGLILHWKSHLKFIAIGLFVGLVMAQTIAEPLQRYLAQKGDFFKREGALNSLQLALLLLPTVILGLNHAADKRKLDLFKMVIYASITTVLLLSSILVYLPDNIQFSITSRSILAFQLVQLNLWILVAGALLIVADSFYLRRSGKKKSKKASPI